MSRLRRMAAALAPLVLLSAAVVVTGAPAAPAAFEIHKVDEAHFAGAPDHPVFVLVLGNDARPGQAVSRADAIHVIGVNPALGKATILDIPRDSYVEIPGGGRDKINSAHARGGPQLMARAVGALVGVPISYVVSTNFEGLVAMVDELGGVDVDVPFAMNDSFSGARFPQGRRHMNGNEALAFSRNRHIPDGDLRRTEDQGWLILAGLAKLRGESPTASATMRYLAVLMRHGRFEGLAPADLYRLGRLALSLDPANVRNVTMPGSPGQAGAASVVFVSPSAGSLFADFRDDAVLQSH